MLGAVSLPTISTGNSLVVRPNTLPVEASGGTSTMSPGQSAAVMFADMRDSLETIVLNTGRTVSLLSKLVIGEKTDDRRESIERAETDEDIPPGDNSGGGGGGGPGFLSGLSKLNPFSSESSALLKFIASGLALIGLNVFKDKLIPKLSSLLEYFFGDDDNSFGGGMEKFIEGLKVRFQELLVDLKEFFEKLKFQYEAIKTEIMKTYEDLKVAYDRFRAYWLDEDGAGYKFVQKVVTFFAVEDYETKDGEMLTQFEGRIKDFKDTLTDYRTYLSALPGILFFSMFFKRAFPIGAPLKTPKGGFGRFGRFLKGGRALGIVGLIAYGLYSLKQSVEDGAETFRDEMVDDAKAVGSFNWTALRKGISDAVTVDDQSGFTGAFKNVLPMGGTAVGIVATLGLPLLAIPGAYPAALFAAAMIGGTAGLITGALGEEKVDQYLAMLDPTVDGMMKDMFGKDSPFVKSVMFFVNAYQDYVLRPFEIIFGKLGTSNDSLLSKTLQGLGADLSPKETPETFLGLGMADQEKYYGKNVNPENITHLSTDELLSMQSDLMTQKQNLARTKPIFGMRFGDGYMDTQNKRTVFKTLDAVKSVLMDRGVIPNPNPKQDSNKVLFAPNDRVMQRLTEMGANFDATGAGDFVLNQQGTGVNNSFNKQEQSFIGAEMSAGMNDDMIEELVKGRL
jgi:hypothetical protein